MSCTFLCFFCPSVAWPVATHTHFTGDDRLPLIAEIVYMSLPKYSIVYRALLSPCPAESILESFHRLQSSAFSEQTFIWPGPIIQSRRLLRFFSLLSPSRPLTTTVRDDAFPSSAENRITYADCRCTRTQFNQTKNEFRPRPADPTLDIEKSWLLSAYLHIVILAARSLLTLTRFLSSSSMLCSRISWAKEQMGGGWSWRDSREVFRVVNKSFPMRNKFRRHTNQHLNFPRMKRIRRIISFPFTVHTV